MNNDVTDANVSDTGLNTADHRDQLITNQTAVDSPFQTPPIIIDQEEEQEDILAKEDLLECEEPNDSLLQYISEIYEDYERELQPVSAKVNGSLKSNIGFWKRIGAPKFVLSVIQEGYKIPFLQTPPSNTQRNNKSALLHIEFV